MAAIGVRSDDLYDGILRGLFGAGMPRRVRGARAVSGASANRRRLIRGLGRIGDSVPDRWDRLDDRWFSEPASESPSSASTLRAPALRGTWVRPRPAQASWGILASRMLERNYWLHSRTSKMRVPSRRQTSGSVPGRSLRPVGVDSCLLRERGVRARHPESCRAARTSATLACSSGRPRFCSLRAARDRPAEAERPGNPCKRPLSSVGRALPW